MKHHPLYTMTLLLAIFLTPMLAAWLAYAKGYFLSGNTVNHGTLLTPSLSLTHFLVMNGAGQNVVPALRGKWTLVYITQQLDSNLTKRNLYYMRQIRQATGKDQGRITRAIASLQANSQFDHWLKSSFPGTDHFIISREKFSELKSNLPEKLALQQGWLYLVDPLGNMILVYTPNASPRGIFKDLQRVLKVSQIG
jgi:hypothetical protein